MTVKRVTATAVIVPESGTVPPGWVPVPERALAIEWMDVAALSPYPHNPRTIPDSAIVKVAASLRKFGWRQPIVVDRNLVVVAGHVRLLAAKALGWLRVPVHVASDLDVADIQAYRLADNRTGEDTGWEGQFLRLEVLELQAWDYNLALTGFDAKELKRITGEEQPNEPATPPLTTHECPKCGYRWGAEDAT